MESSVEVSQMAGPKPSVATKPRLTPKPFSLQKNTTIRSINAPKATGVTPRTTTQRSDKSKAKPPASTPAQKPPKQTPASDSQPSPVSVLKEELPKTARERKASPDGEDAPDSGVGKSDPVTQTAPPKETPKSESIRRDDVNQANRDASSDVVNTPQIHGKKKGDETPTSAVQNIPESGSNAPSADNAENRWGGGRKRLSMKLTSKFESVGVSVPPQPTIPATSTKDDASKPEVPDPEPGHATSKPSDREIDEGAPREEYSGGGSIKRRISLLFDSSSRPEPMTKRDEPEVVNSTEGVKGVKERMKIWAMETSPDGTKAEKPPRVAPRNRSKRLQPATAPAAVKTPQIPTVKPPVTGALSSQPVDLPSKVSPAEPPTDIPMETNKDAAPEDELSKSWRVEHVQNPSKDVDVQLRKRSSFKTHTAADEGVSAEGDSAQHAPKRDNAKRRSVRFSVVERDDGGPPVFLGSASDSSDEEEEGEASEDGAEEEIPVSVPVYRRVGGLQRKDDDDGDKEGERLKHLEFEKKRRSEEHDQPELKMEDELKRKEEEEEEDEEEREKEKARQKKEEARKQDSLKEERLERQRREEWEREQLIEEERKQERFREEEMEREKQMEMLLQRQREEERKSAKQKEQRLKQNQEEREKERLKEVERKEERLRQEREKQKFSEDAINEEKKREDEWEKEWVKKTERLRGEKEKGGENDLGLMEQRQKEERLREERERQRGRKEERLIGNHADYHLEGKLRETEINKKKQREEEWEKEWVKVTERSRGEDEEEELMLQRKTVEDRERARQNEERLRQEERVEERLRDEEKERERERQRRLKAQQEKEETERKRQAEQEEERKRQAEREEERKRQAEREEERKRQAEREEERKRQAEQEEERKRQAEREEERKRQAEREEERKRQAEQEEERKRQAEREEERKRQAERERIEALVRQEVDQKREQDLEEKLRLEEERGREEIESAVDTAKSNLIRFDSKDVPPKSEFPNSPTAKSSQPTEGQLKVVYDDFSARPPLAQVVFDDFSVKPKRWGSQAKVETSPLSNSRSAVSADKEEVQVTLDVTNRALEQVEKPGSAEPTLSWENPKKEEEELISMEEDEEDEEEEEEEDEEEGEEKETQREDEVDEEDEQEAPVNSYSTNSEDTDALIDNEPDDHNEAPEQTSETDGPKLVPDQVPEVSEDVDATDFPREPEHAPFPESSTDLLDTSAQRSKADLGKRRNRTRPPRSLRGGFSHLESTDWRIDDSTDEKEVSSKQREVDSEDEQPKPKIICSPPPATSQRVPMFSGLNPAALIAQLKKRTSGGRTGGGDKAEENKGRGVKESRKEEVAPSPSQLPRSPRSAAHLAGAARVLPPLGARDQGAVSSPAWLKELKSKKRLSQYDSGT
ncbi:trichohyalin-like isoform X2 [Pungitius pungitius]|uniref:trichohyalin-like isoform X2 n=1 Tax=Pungitius pungitius TaxID=134920 RepID=UPI002E0D84C1